MVAAKIRAPSAVVGGNTGAKAFAPGEASHRCGEGLQRPPLDYPVCEACSLVDSTQQQRYRCALSSDLPVIRYSPVVNRAPVVLRR